LRLLLNDWSGHPFQAQLSRELARRGHTVLHTYCSSYSSGKGSLAHASGDPATLEFRPVPLRGPFAKYSMRKRVFQELEFGKLISRVADSFEPDEIISSNMPLFAQRRLQGWANKHGVGFTYWLQDIYTIPMRAELSRRMPVVGDAAGRLLNRLEAGMLRSSKAVVTISEDFRAKLTDWGVDAQRLFIVENWAPIEEIEIRPRHNAWSSAHQLDDRPVFLYAGTLGLKHDPSLLLDLARRLSGLASLVVVSEGNGADFIRSATQSGLIDNVTVLPFQAYADLPDVLATADVLLVILEADAGVFSVPSKVLTYLCAGRPILACVPPQNLAARTICAAEAGLVVSPGDVSGWLDRGAQLAANPKLRDRLGSAGRSYAERTFDIKGIAARFDAIVATPAPMGIHPDLVDVRHAA
jgi:putative colanic acid biosynthesis glycosyltransferase WcaI